MKCLIILGRQPAIGLAELESLYGSIALQPTTTPEAVILDADPSSFRLEQLGGAMKAARVLNILDTTQWSHIHEYLLRTCPEHLRYAPEGKLKIGLSVYGLPTGKNDIYRTGIELKKSIKAAGRSVRVVPNSAAALSSAQVLHNHLTGSTGCELLLIRDGQRTILAQTFAIQDIDAYAARDQARPMRDARVGMLPPKLAQIILNLAVGPHVLHNASAQSETESQRPAILDPFCGTGVILQEALLMGYDVYGSDLEPRMVEYTRQNLAWLTSNDPHRNWQISLEPGDATNHQWSQPFTVVATETYLGLPLTSPPSSDKLKEMMLTGDIIHRKFLANLANQIPAGTRLCLALPAWRVGKKFEHLKILDKLTTLGYKRVLFQFATASDLVYYRDNQFVGRELVVLQKV